MRNPHLLNIRSWGVWHTTDQLLQVRLSRKYVTSQHLKIETIHSFLYKKLCKNRALSRVPVQLLWSDFWVSLSLRVQGCCLEKYLVLKKGNFLNRVWNSDSDWINSGYGQLYDIFYKSAVETAHLDEDILEFPQEKMSCKMYGVVSLLRLIHY